MKLAVKLTPPHWFVVRAGSVPPAQACGPARRTGFQTSIAVVSNRPHTASHEGAATISGRHGHALARKTQQSSKSATRGDLTAPRRRSGAAGFRTIHTSLAGLTSLLILLATPILAGCGDNGFDWSFNKKPEKKSDAPLTSPDPRADAGVFEGTVRQFAYVGGFRKLRVRGFGIVGALANTGGGDCPAEIRKYLEGEIRRRNSAMSIRIDPKSIFDNPQFAPVVVTAEIPAAATKGDRFDVVVRALGSQTTSLEGGRLYFCDLKMFQATPRGIIEGQALGHAAGPIYVSPFGREEAAATRSDPRFGRVLGGGVLKDDRRLRLILHSPSYPMAVRIRDRLRGRFGATEPNVADAVSPSTINLVIPREFRDRPQHFVDLVMHTQVVSEPARLTRRAAELVDQIVHPLAPYEDIALIWEAMGRTIVPTIAPLYDHQLEAAAYYAARTGLRLGDDLALEVVGRHAADPKSPFREAAVRELGNARASHRAADRLFMLLSDADTQVRVLAYEALVRRGDPRIRSYVVWDDNFTLDVIECDGPPLVYARQSEEPRIAILAREGRLLTPLLYTHRDDLVTLSAQPNDDCVWAVRKNPINKRLSDPIRTSLDIVALIRFLGGPPIVNQGQVESLGLNYTVIVDVLDQLTRDQRLPAVMVLERPRVSEDLGRATTRERRESEL